MCGAGDGGEWEARVAGIREPGQGSSWRRMAEGARCLGQDVDDTAGGIWTTAPAFGDKLIKRLVENAGLKFQIEG